MQGRSDPQRELLDVDAVAGHLLPAGSIYAFLAEQRGRLFPAEMFVDLFLSGRGRPSVPADVVAAAIVLQTLNGLSDRETADAVTFDLRWKAALGLAVTSGAFHPTTLTVWRRRLAASDRPQRIFEVVRQVIIETGAVKGKTRRAMDSTILDDAVARQDTVTQLIAAIRRVARVVAGADVLVAQVCTGHDYLAPGRQKKPDIAWGDQDARDELVSALVTDALRVLAWVQEQRPGLGGGSGGGRAAGGGVAGPGRRAGRRTGTGFGRQRRAVADRPPHRLGPGDLHRGPGRPPRPQDPAPPSGRVPGPHRDRAGHRADHADRTEQGQRPGQQRRHRRDPTGRRRSHHRPAPPHTPPDTGSGLEVLGDSAYGSGEALAALQQDGHTPIIKPGPLRSAVEGGFTVDDFTVDEDTATVTCPNQVTRPISRTRQVTFGKACNGCPLRAQCTTSATGRGLHLRPHDALQRTHRIRAQDPAFQATYRRHRPMVERSIAWLTRGNRRVPYRGITKNNTWIHHRVAALNLRRMITLGLTHHKGIWALITP